MSNVGKKREKESAEVAESKRDESTRQENPTVGSRIPEEPQTFKEVIIMLLKHQDGLSHPPESPDKVLNHQEKLGYGPRKARQWLKVTATHVKCVEDFKDNPDKFENDDAIIKRLHDISFDFSYLLSQDKAKFSLLHHLFEYYEDEGVKKTMSFPELRPLVGFLARLQPSLLTSLDEQKRTPLFMAIGSAEMDNDTKSEMIKYLCNDVQDQGIVDNARKSLTMTVKLKDDYKGHALHLAIQEDVVIDSDILRHLNDPPQSTKRGTKVKAEQEWLKQLDSNGNTPLHLALRKPFSKTKILWAKTLVALEPTVLKIKNKPSGRNEDPLTPLQQLLQQMMRISSERKDRTSAQDKILDRDLGELVDLLKYHCLNVCCDDLQAKEIMYKKENKRQISLAFAHNDEISGKYLYDHSKHCQLDTTLRSIYIPKVKVEWDEMSNESKEESDKWECPGRRDLFMIFDWLKTKQPKVKKIIEVVVDDLECEHYKMSHSDHAIVQCLEKLQVEIWDWRRMDIPSHVISLVAGEYVRVVNLYCSGLKAVLQGWSSTTGLPKLPRLEEVYLETHQGRESVETMNNYLQDFKEELIRNFASVNKGRNPLQVECKPIRSTPRATNKRESGEPRSGDNPESRVEEDWLVCMDKFKEFIIKVPGPKKPRAVKVALIDDGVNSNYDGLNASIENGETWARQQSFSWGKPGRGYRPNYYSSHGGHGTVMAWYIRRVFPDVKLYVAKLDPQGSPEQVTFSIDSAAQAISWAVQEGVDIISMSWAIDMPPGRLNERCGRLQRAIKEATESNILLFCANPDKGPGESEPQTLPRFLPDVSRLFCIGAAKNDGQRWEKIATNDKTFDFLLPGVRLGIQVESQPSSPNDSKPPKEWREHSGSSLACALAAGLAGMILHCAQLGEVDDAKWAWLKTHDGMRQTLRAMQASPDGWLAVSKVFGQQALKTPMNREEARNTLEKDVLYKLFHSLP